MDSFISTKFDTPILFLIFNRPDTTALVFEKIKELKPAYLFVAGDGPRESKVGEIDICEKTRQTVLQGIDWDCELKTLFRNKNLGCGEAVSSAIDWFFNQVEEGVIIEDDIIPDLSFFEYASKMLAYYKDDQEVMHIAANSFHSFSNKSATADSYYFSRLPFIWGWATWRRAWQLYDYSIVKRTPSYQVEKYLHNAFNDNRIIDYWKRIFSSVAEKDIGFTWDYQWFLSIWKNNGKVILPEKNLVKNIGWGEGATHTNDDSHHLANLKFFPIETELKHPVKKDIDDKLEFQNFKNFYMPPQKGGDNIFFISSFLGKLEARIKLKIRFLFFKLFPELKKLSQIKSDLEYYSTNISNSNISPKAKFYEPGKIFDSTLGDYSYIAPNASIRNTSIGKFCSIGPNFCCGYGIHPLDGISTSPMFYSTKRQNGVSLSGMDKIEEVKPITIGNDVFVGINVTILDGVTIGDGAVVAAGAVVISDIPPYAIVGGVPAKIIKYRFENNVIERMRRTGWHNFNDADLAEIEENFFNVETFLEKKSV